jgi:hypothetical protein
VAYKAANSEIPRFVPAVATSHHPLPPSCSSPGMLLESILLSCASSSLSSSTLDAKISSEFFEFLELVGAHRRLDLTHAHKILHMYVHT